MKNSIPIYIESNNISLKDMSISEVIKYIKKNSTLDEDSQFKQTLIAYFQQLDFEDAIKFVQWNGMTLKFLSPSLKNNKDIVLDAIKECSNSFKFAGDEIKNNFEFAKTALTHGGPFVYLNLSETLKNNFQLNKHLVSIDGRFLILCPEHFKKHKDIVLMAFSKNPYALMDACPSLINNHHFILESLKIHPAALFFMHESNQNDLQLLKAFKESFNNFSWNDTKEEIYNDIHDLYEKKMQILNILLKEEEISKMMLNSSKDKKTIKF